MRVYAIDESLAQLLAEQGHEVILLDRSLDAVDVGDESSDVWFIALGQVDALDALKKLVKRNPIVRIVVTAHPNDRDRTVEALLAGARSFVTIPGDVTSQLARVLEEVGSDNGTPATFIERLVQFHELGNMLIRRRVLGTAAIERCREMVSEGSSPNLYEAIRESSLVAPDKLLDVLEGGHRVISMAFMLMKTRKLTMQQLRAAFEFAKTSSRDLRWWIIDLGFASAEDCDWTPPQPPPSGRPTRPPRGGGGPSGGAAAALAKPLPPPIDLYGTPRPRQ